MSTPFSNETRLPLPGRAAGVHPPGLVSGTPDPAGGAASAPADPFPADPFGDFERFREAAFFPVRPEPMQLEKNGQPVPGYRAIVGPGENGKEKIFSVVSEGYELIRNEQVFEIGRRLFAKVFGGAAARDMLLLGWGMPESRASFHADFSARCLGFVVAGDGPWSRFLRVKNSYNKSCQVRFCVGVLRFSCGNGLPIEGGTSRMVGDTFEDRHRRTMDEWIRDLEEREFTAADLRQFEVERIRAQLARIESVPVPGEQFLAGLVRVLGIDPPAFPDPARRGERFASEGTLTPKRRRYWAALGRHLEGLAQKYRASQGDNAFALLNAATDYASDRNAPGMHVDRLTTLQFRPGRLFRELSEPGARFEVSEDDLAAARRLRNAVGRDDHFSYRLERS